MKGNGIVGWLNCALTALAMVAGSNSIAQEVGQITYVQGIASAQRPGGEARFLGQGDSVMQGEVINTSERGYAVLALKDGSKITVRSNTAFAVAALNDQPGNETLALNLLRGGLRVFTGLISKARPRSTNLTTPTATVGIRGTEFDARICSADCAREAPYARPVPPGTDPVMARVVFFNGNAAAVARDGGNRPIGLGSAIYAGEAVRTAEQSQLVLAFRDQTKVTLIEKTEFRLENVRSVGTGNAAAEGNFVARLVTGGLRAFTGLIAKRDRSRVQFVTPTATVGIRGTGIDLRIDGAISYLYTWDGAASLEGEGREVVVDRERAASFEAQRGGPVLLAGVPQFFLDERAPRPDQVEVDFDALFALRRVDEIVPGLYLGVRKGDVSLRALAGNATPVDLGAIEAAMLPDGSNVALRIVPPGFLFNDPLPLPDNADLRPLRLIELVGPGRLSASDQCLLQ